MVIVDEFVLLVLVLDSLICVSDFVFYILLVSFVYYSYLWSIGVIIVSILISIFGIYLFMVIYFCGSFMVSYMMSFFDLLVLLVMVDIVLCVGEVFNYVVLVGYISYEWLYGLQLVSISVVDMGIYILVV